MQWFLLIFFGGRQQRKFAFGLNLKKKQQDDRIIIKIAFQAFAMNAFNKSQVFS